MCVACVQFPNSEIDCRSALVHCSGRPTVTICLFDCRPKAFTSVQEAHGTAVALAGLAAVIAVGGYAMNQAMFYFLQ